MTFRPSFISKSEFLSSRDLLFDIFFLQKSIFEDGNFPFLQLCPCQKHPFINITVLYLGKTISGLPGNVLTLIRYQNPFENKNLRTKISGFVFFPPILDIISDRF